MLKKYYSENELTYRASHVNQVRGYMIDSDYNWKKYGALLYPALNIKFSKGKIIRITGTPIIIKTIDLNRDWKDLKADLLNFINKIFNVWN